MNNKPIIGVIACNKPLEGEPAQTVKNRYVEAVAKFADSIPVIIPSLGRPEDIPPLVASVHAILLTGALSNLEPHHFNGSDGREPRDPARDSTAFTLIKAARAINKPIIGICRGMQEINVALGGSLIDQRDGAVDGITHHAPDGTSLEDQFAHSHQIDIAPASRLEKIVGAQTLLVNSVHYQCIERLGQGLRVEATAPDGVIEAISSREGDSIFAVQWHPEWRPEARPHDLAFWRHVGYLARAGSGQFA